MRPRLGIAALLAAACATGGLACGDVTYVGADALPLAGRAEVVESIRVRGVADGTDLDFLVVTGPRGMDDLALRAAEEAALRRAGWRRTPSYLANVAGYRSDDVYATLAAASGRDSISASATRRLAGTVEDLQRMGRPVLIVSLAPR